MEELIREYFRKGYSYGEIVNFLQSCHGIKISLRTLKSRLQAYGLKRRGHYTDDHIETVVQSVNETIRTKDNNQGYRNIWHALNLAGISTTRDLVMNVLRELDPEGAALRKKKRSLLEEFITQVDQMSYGMQTAMTNSSRTAFLYMAVLMATAVRFYGFSLLSRTITLALSGNFI